MDFEWDDRARRLGYSGTAELLNATRLLSVRELADLLEITPGRVARVRRLRGRPAPVPAEDRRQIPAGIQPSENGHLLCLECGEFYDALAIHLSTFHAMTVYEYQVRHGLPSDTILRGTSAEMRDSAFRDARAAARADLLARMATRDAVRPEPEPGQHRSYVTDLDKRWNMIARGLGYAGMGELLDATRTLSVDEAASLLDVPPGHIVSIRYLRDRPAPLPAPDLARIPGGTQPAVKGHLLCLECGGHFRSLVRHVPGSHGVALDEYRSRHGLPPGTRLSALTSDETDAVLPDGAAADPERLPLSRAIARADLLDRIAARDSGQAAGPGNASAPSGPDGAPGTAAILAALGNHEGKALTYLAMKPGTQYGPEDLYRLFLRIQGQDPAFTGTMDLPEGYCAQAFGPAGLARRVRDERGRPLYALAGHCEATTALAGHLLSATEAHPAGLGEIFGERSLREIAAPSLVWSPGQRLSALRLLLASHGRTTRAEVARSLKIRPDQSGAILESFARAGLVIYQPGRDLSAKPRFLVTAVVQATPARQAVAEHTIVSYLNECLARHEGPDALEVPLEDIEAYLWTFRRWRDRKPRSVRQVMTRLALRGEVTELVPPAPRRGSTIEMTGPQLRFIRLLVEGIDRIAVGDDAAIQDGAGHAREIIADPFRVRALMAKVYEPVPVER